MTSSAPSAVLLAGLEVRGIDYVSRLRANPVLDRLAEPFMKRPPGRRPAEPRMWLHELLYQAKNWETQAPSQLEVVRIKAARKRVSLQLEPAYMQHELG